MKTNEEIVLEYQNGKSMLQIHRENSEDYSYRAIQRIVKESGVAIRGGRKKKSSTLSPSQIQYLKKEYCEKSIDAVTLAREFGWDKSVMRDFIKEQGWQKKTQNRVNKELVEDYFEVIDSSDKAYFLGLLFTDGNVRVVRDNTYQIRLQLQSSDREILDLFKKTIKVTTELTHDNRGKGCYGIEFVSKKMFEDLAKYGIVPRKTYVTENLPLNIPDLLKKDFLRGMIDGDGSISIQDPEQGCHDITVGFTTFHKSMAEDFQREIDKIIKKDRHSKVFFTTAWHCQWRGRLQTFKILDALYKDCGDFAIKRKLEKYLVLKQSFEVQKDIV